MKRAAPYLLFAVVTAAVFWKFLLFGQTMYAMSAVESQLGVPSQPLRGWFRSEYRHTRISDNVALLALHLRIYNEGLHRGELRLWNPYLVCGLPTASDPMVHPFYPPNLILHAVFSPDVAYELNLLLHLFFAGVAFYALLRSRGRSEIGATAGALVWMLCGYNAMWFSTTILCGLMVFGPLAALWALEGLEKRDRRRSGLASAALGMAVLGSHPHHAMMFSLFLLAWLGFATWKDRRDLRFTLGYAGVLVLLTGGISAVEVLLRLDAVANGYREPFYDVSELYAEPFTLVTYVAGILIGKAYFPGPGWEAEFPVYLGLAALAPATVAVWRQRRETHTQFLAAATLAILACAFFRPLATLFQRIPLLGMSPASRLLFLVGFAVAFLAGHGVDALAAAPGKAWRAVAWCGVAFLIAMLVGVGPVAISNGAAIETLLGFGLAGAAAFVLSRSKPAAAGLGLAALLFELLPPYLQYNAHSDSSLLTRTPPAIGAVEETAPWRGTGILGTTAVSNKTEQWGNDLVTGNNLLALYGVENIGGFEAILPLSTVSYGLAAGAVMSPAGRTMEFTKLDSALLDFVGLKYVWLPSTLPLPPRYRKLGTYGAVSLFENPAALPRARLAPHVRVVANAVDAEAMLKRPEFDPKWEVIIESDHPLHASVEGDVTWKERSTDRCSLSVNANAPAVLVLADADYPDWEATVDGAVTPILRANLAFRAVEVPAGTHRVDFRYRPEAKRHGVYASIFFLLLSLAAARFWRAP